MASYKARNLRLRREYKELLSSPITNCAAEPLEDDISIWHANIYVPSLRITFHFQLEYPSNYPNKAPKVKNFTHISHPNVFGDYICLDILTMSEETSGTPFRGWTSAYTISSLLVQLQSFLFEAITTSGYSAQRMKTEAARFVCKCGHSTRHPTPKLTPIACKVLVKTGTPKNQDYFFLDDCDKVILSFLFEFLDEETLGKVNFLLGDVTDVTALALAKRSYKCFYTLTTLEDERAVFGLGAKKFIMPRRSRKTGKRQNKLQQLHCSFDFLCHDAFKMGVRNNIWKDRDFDCFIPLYINSKHGRRALPMAEKCILDMWNCSELSVRHKGITATLILETLSKLMNTTVVNMMKTVEDLEAGELQLFDSIKALKGYTSIHHLLLAFCDRYPEIQSIANARVERFIKNPVARDKEITPDIGELLIDLAISDYSWNDFSPAWIEEVFIRNARWILSKYPNLFTKEKGSSCIRMTQSFHATRTGQRLAMFQRFFISEVALPDRLIGNPEKNKILLKEYNERLGSPAKGIAERLQEHSRKVIACNNWWDYFNLVDFCCPSAAHLSAWLRSAIEVSELKSYHKKSLILRYPENFISKPRETIQCNPRNCLCAGALYKLPKNFKPMGGAGEAKVKKPKLLKPKKVGVDICFVMDCTGSMSSILATAKEHINKVVDETSRKFNGEKVRFAIVGYRDHDSPGYGSDSYVLKKFDFTSNAAKMQKNVSQFNTGGGGGPEAMCCAMAAAAEMSWNRSSRQIVVLIGDQPPHGYQPHDSPCECGHDTLRVVHTMKKNGIVVYPVDCGRPNGDRQTFYHGLARITGGYAFDISEANLLPELVVGASAEEGMLEQLKEVVEPMYEECIKSHPLGRFEQHCQAVFSECKAKNITTESALPGDGYSHSEEHAVDCIAFCTDIKQAQIMSQKEYFGCIRRKTKLCSYMKRPVSLEQVTRCMKRMQTNSAEKTFLKTGCQYLSHKRFSMNQFKKRWVNFKSERNIGTFSPWNKLTYIQKTIYSKIPGPMNLTSSKKVPKKISKAAKNVITHKLVGRTIEVKLHDVWTRLKIVKLLRDFKVLVKFQNYEFPIEEDNDWRPTTALAGWARKNSTKEEEEISPILLKKLKAMDSLNNKPTKEVAVEQKKLENQNQENELNIVDWVRESVEKKEKVETEVVTQPISSPSPVISRRSSINSSVPVVSRPLPINSSAPVVSRPLPINSSAPVVSRPPPINYSAPVVPRPSRIPSAPSTGHNFVFGQLVNCRNNEGEEWRVGVVASTSPLQVKFEKNGPVVSCRYIESTQLQEYTLRVASPLFSQPGGNRSAFDSHVFAGTKVRSLEAVNGYLHIISPEEGWINESSVVGFNPLEVKRPEEPVQIVPEVKVVQPAVEAPKQEAPAVLCETGSLVLNVFHVPESVSARDLAKMCMNNGVTPKKIKKVLTQYGIAAVISFATHEEASQIYNLRRLSDVATRTHMPIQWSEAEPLNANSTRV